MLFRSLPFSGIKNSEEGPWVATVFSHTPRMARQEPQPPSPASTIIGKLRGMVYSPLLWCCLFWLPGCWLSMMWRGRGGRLGRSGTSLLVPASSGQGERLADKLPCVCRAQRNKRKARLGPAAGEGSSRLHTWPGAPWPPQNEPPLRKGGTHYGWAGVLRTTRLCKVGHRE